MLRDIRAELPDDVWELPDEERAERADVEDDFCRLDGGGRYFVRGLIEIPIHGDTYFGYGVWVEVTEEDCFRLRDTWHEPLEGVTFRGRLANELDNYPGSRGLSVSLRTRQQLPAVRIEDEHGLATEQREGISEARADELAAAGYH